LAETTTAAHTMMVQSATVTHTAVSCHIWHSSATHYYMLISI